jgi:predicted RNase H-like HicB family nuclease
VPSWNQTNRRVTWRYCLRPGLVAHGESEETAVELLDELLRNHLAQLENAGQPLPDDGVEILWDEEDDQAGAKLVHIEV